MVVAMSGAWAGQNVGSEEGEAGANRGARSSCSRRDLREGPSHAAWKSLAIVTSASGWSAGRELRKSSVA
jgi:hypothetical protein